MKKPKFEMLPLSISDAQLILELMEGWIDDNEALRQLSDINVASEEAFIAVERLRNLLRELEKKD